MSIEMKSLTCVKVIDGSLIFDVLTLLLSEPLTPKWLEINFLIKEAIIDLSVLLCSAGA